jgi:hypothetical protein
MSKMTKYKCDFCNYSTEIRQYWHKHKKTKKHLAKIEENNNPQLTENNPQLTEQNPQLTEQNPQLTEQNPQLTEQNRPYTRGIRPNINGLYQCYECNNTFINKKSYYYHHKRCNIHFECDFCGKNYQREKMYKKHIMKCKVNNATIINNNNTTINNITNNNNQTYNDNRQITINILPHGEEDFKRLLDPDLIEYIKEHNFEDEFMELSKYIFKYFYLDIEEHKNIKVSNLRALHCSTKMEDGEYKMKRFKSIFDEKLYKLKREFYNIRDRDLKNFQLALHNVANSIPDDKEYGTEYYKTKREIEQEYKIEMYNNTN